MILRLFYILLFVCVTYLCDSHPELQQETAPNYPHSEVVADTHAEQLICCKEYNSDMLRTPRSMTTITSQSNTVTSQQVRYHGEEQLKFYATAVPARRAGHVTQIFEFNQFRSSLRVAYYLHTLCRLRI